MFMLNNNVHDYHTRSCTHIHVEMYNLSIGQRTFAYRGVNLSTTRVSREECVQLEAFPVRCV